MNLFVIIHFMSDILITKQFTEVYKQFNLVKLSYVVATSKNNTYLKSGQKRLKNIHHNSLVLIRDTLCCKFRPNC